jgi:endonuclease YncB( thermonuclease family)
MTKKAGFPVQKHILSEGRFGQLLIDLRKLIDVGRDRAQSAANWELLKTYWNVGERLADEKLTETAGYGESVMERLAQELKTDRSTLVRCLQFHEGYPKGPPDNTPLTWSHFRALLTVKDDKARLFYENTAIEKKWTRDELVRAIQADHFAEDENTRSKKPAKQLKRPEGEPFIYRAEVVRVVDGDTLLVRLDLGFDVWIGQRIRLAAIDTPPLKDDGGEEAVAYVRDQLAKAAKVVIRTSKEDVHGRFVGHVFYSLDDRMEWGRVYRDGRWLNQELLDRGLARIY